MLEENNYKSVCTLQVEVNILTGETKILQADIVYDCGQSMNPAVDMGQVLVFVFILYSIIYTQKFSGKSLTLFVF